MFNRLVTTLAMLTALLFAVALIGIYQWNVYMPAQSPSTQYVPSKDPNTLQLYLNSDGNYDVISVLPYQDGYLVILKNRPKLVDMWQ
jgi:hypothetical protein